MTTSCVGVSKVFRLLARFLFPDDLLLKGQDVAVFLIIRPKRNIYLQEYAEGSCARKINIPPTRPPLCGNDFQIGDGAKNDELFGMVDLQIYSFPKPTITDLYILK